MPTVDRRRLNTTALNVGPGSAKVPGTTTASTLGSLPAAGRVLPEHRLGAGDRRNLEVRGRRREEAHPDHLYRYVVNRSSGFEVNHARPGAQDFRTATMWTVKDVAEFLQASESWVRHAAAGGRLPCTKIGGLLRFDPDEIQKLSSVGVRGRVHQG